MILISRKIVVLLLLTLTSHLASSLPVTPDASKDDQDNYRVETLPGLDKLSEVPIMYSGHLQIDESTNTNYFFWKFIKPREQESSNRTIFWLNGGPGCSSMDGALMEVGPLRINKDIEVEFNNGSWYEQGDLVFVDQPGGTGFSYTDAYDKELSQVADDFMIFLKEYFQLFPNDLNNEIYLAGESYAGQYIPYIAKAISNSTQTNDYNLKGLLIGNGWISPNEQSLSYIPFMMDAGFISQHDSFFPDLLQRQEACQNAISKGETKSIRKCDSILDYILSYTKNETANDDSQCVNMYDYSLRDSFPSCGMNWPPLLPYVTKFLRDEKVMKLLNLKKFRQWNECDSGVSRNLKAEHSQQSIVYIPDLLTNYKVMLFNGARDIICNTMGTEMMISNMEWAGSRGFSSDVEQINWYYDDTIAGTVKSQDNLTFVNVYNASHMVPFDNSAISRGLMDIMIENYESVDNGIETPVYNIKRFETNHNNSTSLPGHQSKPEYNDLISSHSAAFYIFEIIVVIIILYGIHYFYKYYNDISSRRPTSILQNGNANTNRKSKKVHWFDEMDENFINGDVHNSQDQQEVEEDGKGIMSNLWNKWTSSYSKVPTNADHSNNEDIEMSGGEVQQQQQQQQHNNRLNEDFIVESEDEQ